jgi:hypothetical protein
MTFGTRWLKNRNAEDVIDLIANDIEKKNLRKRWATFVQRGNQAKRERVHPSAGLDEIKHLFEPPFGWGFKRPKMISNEDLDLYYGSKPSREME